MYSNTYSNNALGRFLVEFGLHKYLGFVDLNYLEEASALRTDFIYIFYFEVVSAHLLA